MKLVRFGTAGKEKPGIIDKNGKIRDLSKVVKDIDGEALSPAGLAKIKKANIDKLPLVEGNPRLGPCVARPSNFIAIGLNYADHAAEAGMKLPPEPIIFNKALSCICGPNDNTITPKGSSKLDYEVELGIVIGKRAQLSDEGEGDERGRRLFPVQRRVRARVPDRARRPVDQGQGLRDASARSAPGSSPRTRSRTRRTSTSGSRSTARSARRATPRP